MAGRYKIMEDNEYKRKPFEQCSRRHQRRIIQKDIAKINHYLQCGRQLNNNRLENSFNTFHNSTLNSSFAYIDNKAEVVRLTNNELLARSLEKDFDDNLQIYFEFEDESNMQLFDFSSDKLEIDNEEYWKELISDNNEYNNYIFNDDSHVNKIFDADIQFDNEEVENFINPDLREWALCNNISHKAINELLHLLLKYIPNCFLPKDARTLLHTPRTTNCVKIAGGEYLHFGLLNVMNLLMEKYIDAKLAVDSIILSMNVDGLPISRSSPHCLWPILISDKIFKSVHMIGAYYGSGKPTSANDFLEQFINELKILIKDGFMYGTRRINVTLSTIVCDAPAKSFVLYTKSHTGFSSCSKCTIMGKSINSTICFPYTNETYLRTDEDFLQQTDKKYHQGETLLLQIPNIGLVSAVALDYI